MDQLNFENTEVTKNATRLLSVDQIEVCFGNFHEPETAEILKLSSQKFLDEMDGRLEQMEKAIQQMDIEEIIFSSHQLKGSFNTLGSPILGAACHIIEKNAEAEDYNFLIHHCQTIQSLSPLFRLELIHFINHI